MPSTQIQWFPGHMAKTRRLISECLPYVDIVIELRDARIPHSSRNPEIWRLCGNKPVLTVFAKSDLADPRENDAWRSAFEKKGRDCLFIDCKSNACVEKIGNAVNEVLAEKLAKYEAKGMSGRTVKAMVVGIPNVGKSTLINKLAGSKKAKAEDRPGVTTSKQWVSTNIGIDLLDMPGVLWPKFDDEKVGENLAATKAIKDDILDCERIATSLCATIRRRYPELVSSRYKLGDIEQYADLEDWEFVEVIGKKRGFLVSGGEVNYERTSNMLLAEFRGGQIGRITLEGADEYADL